MVRCDGCAFDYDREDPSGSGRAIVAAADRLASLLTDGVGEVGRRRDPGTWSPLEYGCHVRDVLVVQRERVLLARRVENPLLEPMGRDERAEHDGYAEQDPAAVARQLGDAARLLENVLDRLGPDGWSRTVRYNYPEPAERSLAWVAVHTHHEARHHLLDVERQLG